MVKEELWEDGGRQASFLELHIVDVPKEDKK
jgi:hypothetical protein